METQELYTQRMQAQLDEWNAEASKLKAKADKATAQAKIDHQKELDQLQKKREAFKAKLDELKSAGGEAWQDVKAGTDAAREALAEAMKSARERFQ